MPKELKFHLAITVVATLLGATIVMAEEGGSGHYVPGSVATLIDIAPTEPGFSMLPLFLHYGGSFGATKTLPVAGSISIGLDATIDSVALGGFYTFDQTLLGARFSVGAYLPYVWMDVTGTIRAFSINDKAEGLGDITIIPAMLAWNSGKWIFDALLSVYAPTGDFEVGRLANPGLNYWTIDPTIGAAYSNPETGLNFGVHAGITFNTENSKTNYRSGSVLHVEASVQQLIPVGNGLFGFGLNGFLYEQITGDNGIGATSSFKGRGMGVGPVFNYIPNTENGAWVFEAKWLPEFNTENRLEGDYFWFKVAKQF